MLDKIKDALKVEQGVLASSLGGGNAMDDSADEEPTDDDVDVLAVEPQEVVFASVPGLKQNEAVLDVSVVEQIRAFMAVCVRKANDVLQQQL